MDLIGDVPWRFVTSAPTVSAFPPPMPPEFAFIGRSNVGKSSLINALTQTRNLARASNTPGRTQALNFFTPDQDRDPPALALVDMPGYGFAKAPKARAIAWTRLARDYIEGRSTLKRLFLLVDSRHGLKPADRDLMDFLDGRGVSYQIILTKSDLVSQTALGQEIADISSSIADRPAAFPEVIATSAKKKWGLDSLRVSILQAVD